MRYYYYFVGSPSAEAKRQTDGAEETRGGRGAMLMSTPYTKQDRATEIEIERDIQRDLKRERRKKWVVCS